MSHIDLLKECIIDDDMVCGLCFSPDLHNPENEKKDFVRLYRTLALIPDQTHSCNVVVATRGVKHYDDTDALITFERDMAVGVKTADCVPILLFAPDKGAVGAVHAGWKGTLGGIVDNVMDILEDNGVDVSLLKVYFGPSISKEVYEVSPELAEKFIHAGFGKYVSYPHGLEEKPHIDLQGVNMERFIRRGVSGGNISLHPGCSFSSKMEDGTARYASHRRSGGAPARILTCIKLL
ncbi:MAG: polyphenol oxidase family protein [Muribaculaceae bacterium]|nr:polyphenol oxidase family protein [Muribaculaceae bacterium]